MIQGPWLPKLSQMGRASMLIFLTAVPFLSAPAAAFSLSNGPQTLSVRKTARGAACFGGSGLRMKAGGAKAGSAAKLRDLLAKPEIQVMPCCFDALSAKLIERAGFEITFMSGFSTSAAKLALPDTGYISYGEMIDAGRDICNAVSIPVLGDGDTGYGNAMNVKRTVQGYARTGFASIMIEDQVAPKRCGHTKGKDVVSREVALQRVKAACDARDEGDDILILARTDARATLGFDEAMERVRLFEEAGADIVFLEAPQTLEEMKMHCEAAPNTPKLANMLEGGKTPILPPVELQKMGYDIAAYPLTLLSTAVNAMNQALGDLKEGKTPESILEFAELRDIVGFNDYYAEEERYKMD